MSGNIYGIYITEDYCSKTLRLSETCHLLSNEELVRILSNSQLWLLHDYEKLVSFWKSDAIQAMLFGLDDECKKRIDDLDSLTQWKLAAMLCKLQKLFRCIDSRINKSDFLAHLLSQKLTSLNNHGQGISGMKLEEFILLMCIVSVSNCQKMFSGEFEQVLEMFHAKILTVFDDINANELAICYSAMKNLNISNINELEDRISAKYGFRF